MARSAYNQRDAQDVGFLGVEKDETPDSEYAAPGAGEGPNKVKLRKPRSRRKKADAPAEASAAPAPDAEEASE